MVEDISAEAAACNETFVTNINDATAAEMKWKRGI